MSPPAFAQPLKNFAAMARFPSHRAPRAQELLNPPVFQPPQAPVMDLQERMLLDAVIAKPDEDAPRRAMADWLGGDRGLFIHAQLGGERLSPDPAWATVFEPWCARDLVYRRGFVEAMSLAGRAFLTLGEPLFRMTPLQEVRLVAISPFFDELLNCEHIRRLRVLNLCGNDLPFSAIESLCLRFPSCMIKGS